jgi:hypothetical protein
MPFRIKLTRYDHAHEVINSFAAHLTHLARIDEITGDSILISAHDPSWPTDEADRDWLCSTIEEMLALDGIVNVILVPVPHREQPDD